MADRRPYRGMAVALVVAIAALVAIPATARPAAAGTAVVTVDPNTDLGPGQWVKLTWSGYKRSQNVYFRQCDAAPADASADCAPAFTQTGVSDNTGAGTIYLPVSAGEVHSSSGTTFNCDEHDDCNLGAFTDPANLTTATFALLKFAASPADCPSPSGAAILGGGAASPYLAMYRWETIVCQPPDSLSVDYTLAASTLGKTDYIAGLFDFAATGIPFDSDELKQLSDAGKTFAYAPISTSALVVAYKMYQPLPTGAIGAQITDLRLTPQEVTQIFTGKIQNWHFGGIPATNPGITYFPSNVKPYVRGDSSAANQEFTSWMTAVDPTDYPEGPTPIYPGTYSSLGVTAITGADLQALAIAAPNGADFFQNGYIGIMDSSTASYYGLATAQIEQPGGSGTFVSATSDSIDAALTHAKTNDDGTITPDYTTTDPNAYPMPMVDYMVVPTNQLDLDKGDTLTAFLAYAVGDGQSVLPPGYAPLTSALVQQALDASQKIPSNSNPPPSPTPTPTPTPSSTSPPPTFPSDGGGSFDGGSLPPPTFGTPTPTPTISYTTPAPCPTTGPSPTPTLTPSAAAAVSPTPSPSASASPSSSPSASPTPSPTPCATASGAVAIPSSTFTAAPARFVIPALAGLALIGLSVGPALQFLSARRPRRGVRPGVKA